MRQLSTLGLIVPVRFKKLIEIKKPHNTYYAVKTIIYICTTCLHIISYI